MQNLFILSFLPILLQAKVLQRTLEILEHGTIYTQTITFDFDKMIQIIDVPAHNNIVQSRTIFDFNQGMMVEAHPWSQHCYLKDIPETMANMEQMLRGLSKREKAPVNATAAKVAKKRFGHYQEINLSALGNDDLIKECESYNVFQVSEIDPNLPKMSVEVSRTPNEYSGSTNGCPSFHSQCVWQTCSYGSDSCYWTVNCPPTADPTEPNCDDVIHNSNFHGPDGAPIHCDSCFNTQCKGNGYDCQKDWDDGNINECLDHALPECSNDVDLGNDCGVSRCDDPDTFDDNTWKGNHCNQDRGTFACPQDKDHLGYVLDGNMCVFTCGNGDSCGYVICEDDGNYDDETTCN